MRLLSGKYDRMEFFAKKASLNDGEILVKEGSHTIVHISVSCEVYHFFEINLEKRKEYTLSVKHVDIPYGYLCGNEDLFEQGVGFLNFNFETDTAELIDIEQYHNSPIKEQYHFIPVKNWMNDPNGLCYYKGYYHMFYQANPTEQRADFCYWGHAVSCDLTHWKYFPIAVFPQNELLENPENRGGAFSGSAVVKDEELHIFFTRHLGRKNNLEDFCEYQVKAVSTDGVHFKKEKIIIASRPEERMTCDFRDPKITYIDNKPVLVLAGAKNGHAILMEYSTEDLEKWKYEGIILTEEKAVCYECPDLFELNQKVIAIAALMDYVDEDGRFRPTRYYIGKMEQGKLLIETEGNLDFGLNLYAAQSFFHEDRRILIGWIADFNNEHIFMDNGCYGSMSVPRELFVKKHKLYMKPVQEIYKLLGKEVKVVKEDSCYAGIEGNSYYALLKLQGDTIIDILIAESDTDELRFLWKKGTAEIYSSKDRDKNVHYIARLEQLQKIEIFFDRRVAEIFLNDGEAVGSRIFYTTKLMGRCSVQVQDETCLEKMKVFEMESIWNRRYDS